MAKKDGCWFSHDADARFDKDVLWLRRRYGWYGYGLYWVVVEIMRERQADGYRLRWDDVADVWVQVRVWRWK